MITSILFGGGLNDWADLTELGHEILELNSKLN